MATLLMLDGFEHGAVGASGQPYDVLFGTPAIVTTPVRTGLRALEIATANAAENVRYNIPAGNRVVTMSFYVRFNTSLPGGDVRIAHFVNTGAESRVWFKSSASKFAVGIGAHVPIAIGSTITPDQWYRVDVEYDTTGATAILIGQVDGAGEAQDTNVQTAADTTAVGLGTTNVTETFTAYYDDWVISVTDGDYPVGEHAIESLSPSGDGTHNIAASGDFDGTTTQFSNATTDSYLNIDDVPLNTTNTDAEVIRQDLGTTTDYMEHLYSDLAAGSTVPLDVRVYDYDVDDAAVGANLAVLKMVLDDGTPVSDVRVSADDPGTTVTMHKKVLDRPVGGWTRGNVNGLRSRWGFSDADPDARLLGVLIEVAMIPSAPSPGDSFPAKRAMVG